VGSKRLELEITYVDRNHPMCSRIICFLARELVSRAARVPMRSRGAVYSQRKEELASKNSTWERGGTRGAKKKPDAGGVGEGER